MKRLLSLVLSVLMILALFVSNSVVLADDSIKVVIDGVNQTYDVMPVIEEGRTLVPMRAIFEALGATVSWDDATKTVFGTKGDTTVVLQIGNKTAHVNNNAKELDVPAKIVNDRTMVPVRFISESLGCNVSWDDSQKTVIINSAAASSDSNLAELVSTMHRRVPTTFEKSNDMNDLYHFESMSSEEQEVAYQTVRGQGEVVCTEEEFMAGLKPVQGPDFGNYEVVDVEGQNFKKALRITCTKVPEKSSGFIVKTNATPERNPGDGVDGKDQMLLAFRLRLVSGGHLGSCQVQFQIEHPETFKKALFQSAVAENDWTVVYMPFKGVDDATSIGVRAGFCEQVVELGGIEIINFGPDFNVGKLPSTSGEYPELKLDAQWRKEANERIEKIRKGDFKVVVKDGAGNVIPDAEVEFDMFEHEFQFGNAFNGQIKKNETYKLHHEELFNAGVVEHQMKWAPYEDNPQETKGQVDGAKESGVKYMRGHTLIWERDLGSNGKTYLMPKRLFDNDAFKDKEYLLKESEAHFNKICAEYPDMVDWDVVNEIVNNVRFREHHGQFELFKEWFDLARKAAGEDCLLYYNETSPVWNPEFIEYLDKFVENGVDFDGIGIQSHYDGNLKMPTELMGLYDKLAEKYNKRLKITEYSCSIADINLQGNYTRDVMITCFAEENMDGFLMWRFFDGANFAAYSPIYDKDWNLKPAGKVYQDLVYNKWWTKDAKAKTSADGSATIRGFYGDYDVTVTANGKTVTEMVAFHKGYDNILEIVIK